MEIKTATNSELEMRIAEIEAAMTAEDADLEALSAELTEIEARKAELLEIEERRQEEARKIAEGEISGKSIENSDKEKESMNAEMRAQMVDALAEYIKGTATPEQRALLTTNATGGTVKVSDIVDDYIWTDWADSPLLSRIRKVSVPGNYSVGYEASATGAVKHTEGAAAPSEEVLELAYIQFIAEYFKKWITVSDTVLALKGQAFMDYLLREFGHQLAIALEDAIVAEIEASSLTAAVTNPIDNTAVMAGFAQLSDEARNPVVIISKANYAAIMNERTTAGAKIEDPFNGLEVLFNNTVSGMLVGDLDGVVGNFPEGDDFKFIVDDRSLAEKDMVKIVGKILASIHLVRPNGFANVTES